MSNSVRICPNCNNKVSLSDEYCYYCGYCINKKTEEVVMPTESDNMQKEVVDGGSKSTLSYVMRIIGVVLIIAAIILLYEAYKTRYKGNYTTYTAAIYDDEDDIRDYKKKKQEMLDEADSFGYGYFRDAYLDLAADYQSMIDSAETRIAEYQKKIRDIEMKATIILVSAICSTGAGIFLLIKGGNKHG